ncbi:hypothetical protein DPMN_187197 [Dreissena polymorpha]|uniref:Uncharacterized protein n=1 Tax=Dreissena polymorpha TaxID=45954 RepID=A0A9D4I798_DREPO|nr:hypothetical protein DPMN_187197 [Dreissena polymorpha]
MIGGPSQRKCYKTAMLKDNWNQEEFKVIFSNKFQVLEELLQEETMEQKWQKVKVAVTSTYQEVLGPKSYFHKEWISAETLQNVT